MVDQVEELHVRSVVEGPVETHPVVAEVEGPCEERHWVLLGKEAVQETETSPRNANVKIPHPSFGFPSGSFRTSQPTDARDHEVQRPHHWKWRHEVEQIVGSKARCQLWGQGRPVGELKSPKCESMATVGGTRMSNPRREAPETEQHPYQLREKKACGSRRDTAHHIAIVGACPKQWASDQPEATRSMLMRLPHEQMHGQHAQNAPANTMPFTVAQ